MSNYNLAVNWSAKDASGTVISGDDFNTEFNAVKTAVNSKAELNGNSGEDFDVSTLTASTVATTSLSIGGTLLTSTSAELNILDGITAFVDEDDMASDSDTSIPSQQSVKAYVDNNAYSSTDLKSDLNASGTAPIYAVRAWVNFNGTGTPAIRASGNVSSITDNGTGDYTINFTTAMPDANYAVSAMNITGPGGNGAGSGGSMIFFPLGYTMSASSVRLVNYNTLIGPQDVPYWTVKVTR